MVKFSCLNEVLGHFMSLEGTCRKMIQPEYLPWSTGVQDMVVMSAYQYQEQTTWINLKLWQFVEWNV